MQKVSQVVSTVVSLLSQLNVPAVATSVAGVLAPIIAGVAGANFPVGVLAGWIVLVGSIAAGLQKALGPKAVKPAPTPKPPAPPAPPAK